ncbi:probable peroxygenase 4 [Papaver somniferum]|uniref:probable peroxygenase 4 n=1 Tax=Papaver somniferum TaxID=3469 RepID=UPI000E6FB0B5|nr:probable peroxygenase 4 [Papaver somniferum]
MFTQTSRKTFISLLFFSLLASMAVSSAIASNDQSKEESIMNDNNQSVLQKHVAFFDRNKDGVIYPWETFQGFRAIGCGLGLSTLASIFINMGLSGKTRPGKFPNPLFPIVVQNIAKSKHTSDSGVYDTEGRFVASRFEELFQKHSKTNANALTEDELSELLKANRVPKDYGGWVAAYSEWKILYVLGKDKNGLLHKETVRAAYDGSLFWHMEKERAGKKGVPSK